MTVLFVLTLLSVATYSYNAQLAKKLAYFSGAAFST